MDEPLLPSRAARAKELEAALAPPKRPAPEPESAPEPRKPFKKSNRLMTEKAVAEALTIQTTGTNVEVVLNGTNTMGHGTFMEPTSPTAVLNNLILRAQLDPNAPELEPLSPTITGLQQAVKAMSLGEDIAPFKAHIQQVAANQPEKGDVVRSYVNQANQELIADVVEMRANAVRHIRRASRINEVSVGEGLVIWRMCNDQLPELTKSINENGKAVDTVTVVEKIDYQRQQVERSVARHWEGTTPQGREIIRKKLFTLQRQLELEQGIMPLGTEPPEPPPDPIEIEEPATAAS